MEKIYLNSEEYDAAVVEVDEEALTLVNLADVNNDGKIDAGDSVAIMTLMYNKEMNTAADINGDGFIALEDVEAMRKLVLKDAAYTAPVAGAADINKDGNVNALDYALLQKYILGILGYEALANELVGSALA